MDKCTPLPATRTGRCDWDKISIAFWMSWGDYVGTRQSGFVEFKVAKLSDVELLMLAKGEAAELLAVDPELEARKHSGLATLVKRSLKRMTGTPS